MTVNGSALVLSPVLRAAIVSTLTGASLFSNAEISTYQLPVIYYETLPENKRPPLTSVRAEPLVRFKAYEAGPVCLY